MNGSSVWRTHMSKLSTYLLYLAVEIGCTVWNLFLPFASEEEHNSVQIKLSIFLSVEVKENDCFFSNYQSSQTLWKSEFLARPQEHKFYAWSPIRFSGCCQNLHAGWWQKAKRLKLKKHLRKIAKINGYTWPENIDLEQLYMVEIFLLLHICS